MNSCSYPSWNSETHFWLDLLCGWPHPVLCQVMSVSIWYIFLYSFLHSHCCYLYIAEGYLLVFISPCLSLANLLCMLLLEQFWFPGLMMVILLILFFSAWNAMFTFCLFIETQFKWIIFHWVSCHLSPPHSVFSNCCYWHLSLTSCHSYCVLCFVSPISL